MILLLLFLEFLKIGAVSFGGGYGMISLIKETVLSHGWLTEAELLDLIAVAESTPGPIAVNMATFIGSSQSGVLGSLAATLGVILPSFIVILIIAAFISGFLKLKPVSAFLFGVQPAIVAMILSTAFTFAVSSIFGVSSFGDKVVFDHKALIILSVLAACHFLYKIIKKTRPSPIVMLILSAALGILFYM